MSLDPQSVQPTPDGRRLRRRSRPALVRGGVLAAACLLVATTAFVADEVTRPRSSDVPSVDVLPDAAALTPTPSPSEPEEAWTAFTPPEMASVASLTPSKVGPTGVAPTTRFALRSLGAVPVATLAKGIAVEPAVAFTTARADARTVTLIPKAPLEAATSYRVTLRTPDGALAGSWFFRVPAPLRITSTHPGPGATGVATETGIEVTFDQDTPGSIAPFFSMQPAVRGTFERHGRTWAFVPAVPLAQGTVYSVTVRKGVPLIGSDQVLATDLTFAFETALRGVTQNLPSERRPLDAWFTGDLLEVAPGDPPLIGLDAERPYGAEDKRRPLASIDLTIHRLPGIVSALEALRTLREAPDWMTISDAGLVATAGLPVVATVRARVVLLGSDRWNGLAYAAMPTPLERGWYLVVRNRPQRDQQLILQVTDVAAFVQVTSTSSVVWANDISTGRPMDGAVLWTDRGQRVAATRSDGTAVAVLPRSEDFFVTAPEVGPATDAMPPGRALIVPLRVASPDASPCLQSWQWEGRNDAYWRVLAIDRSLYRPSDELDAWGMIRPRDGGAATDVQLRVVLPRYDEGCETAAARAARSLVSVPVTLGGRTGTFAEAVRLRDLPAAYYALELWAGDDLVASRWFQVGEIRKPSYTVDVRTDRHVLLDGDTMNATVTGTFFDGTPAPSLSMTLYRDWNDYGTGGVRLTTGQDGVATTSLAVGSRDSDREDESVRSLRVEPLQPEEAPTPVITSGYVVYPSLLLLDAHATVSDATIRIRGRADVLDQTASEARWAETGGSEWEVSAGSAAGSTVHVEVMDRWSVPVTTGRGYDFIRKRAYDTYEYDERSRALVETDLVTGRDGSFALAVDRSFGGTAAPEGHWYDVTISALDAQGRLVRLRAPVDSPSRWADSHRDAVAYRTLEFDVDEYQYPVGGTARLPLSWGHVPAPTGGSNRYLFLTATRGLTGVTRSSEATFVHPFTTHDVPTMSVVGVWFTGRTYVETSTSISIDMASRELTVTMTPDARRHAPGEQARVTVRTTGPNGRPVASTVILRAVDERLYAIDAAQDEDPTYAVYEWVWSGLANSYASHRSPEPTPPGGQGGDTTGGGGTPAPRETFRDSALFRRVTTDANGVATVSFTLPDDITSWRVSGAAFTGDLKVGQGRTAIAVGLPLFIEAPVAPEYLVSDRPTLLLRAYGMGLTAGRAVTFTVSAPTLGLAGRTVTASAFRSVGVELPALTAGDHRITIRAKATDSNGAVVADALVRTFHVVQSRFTRGASTYVVLPAKLPIPTGSGLATYTFSDAGRGSYLRALDALARGGGDRIDEALGTTIARSVLEEAFGIDAAEYNSYPYPLDRYLRLPLGREADAGYEGVALFPDGSPDLALSARVALLAAGDFGASLGGLQMWFESVRADPAETRERRNLALAGLAALDPGVAPQVVAALATPGLTVRERLYLALAAATLGDRATALKVERAIVKASGQSLGPWLRLKVGSGPTDILEATSLLALVAGLAGDPIAEMAEAYVEEHFTDEDLFDLQKAAFLRAAVDRAPSAPASFAYTLGGVRTVVKLARGETRRIELAPSQWRTFSAQVLSGRVGVTVGWAAPAEARSIVRDPNIALTRTVIPGSPVPAGSVVTVVLSPNFGDFTMHGCYRVVDLAPSGLQPLWWAFGGTHGSEDVLPWVISGQKVVFCASRSSARPPRLVYYARVVTPGTYAWEPALMQSRRATESAALSEPSRIEIR